MEGIVALFIPIIITLITGIVIISFVYFENKTKQGLINRGFSAEEIKELFYKKEKNKQNSMMKIGVISISFGLGLGFGLLLEDWYGKEYYIPMFIFVFTGVGFVLANYFDKKMLAKDSDN